MSSLNTTPRNATTSGTANTWTQLMPTNAGRQGIYIEVPATAAAGIDIGIGAPATPPTVIATLRAGEGVNYVGAVCPKEVISVRSTGTSIQVFAQEWL